MKGKLTINGKEYEVELDDNAIKELTPHPRTGYERVGRNEYHFFADTMVEYTNGIAEDIDKYEQFDDEMYKNADYYSDKDVAKANARADTIMRRLRRFAAEHGGIPSAKDWEDIYKSKYCIGYDYSNFALSICVNQKFCHAFKIHFLSQSAAKQAIELFHDDLLWYFTEYHPMLYEEV